MGIYTAGNVTRLSATFTQGGNAVEPTLVSLEVRNPHGSTTAYMATLSHDGTGLYHYDLSLDIIGTWNYRWFSIGTAQSAAEGSLTVRDSVFA